MKVLLLFPQADGQTGPAIKYAFEKLGHAVMTVDAKLDFDFSYIAAEEFKPDLVFCSRTHQLTEEVEKIKKRMMNVPVCMWNVDVKHNIQRWSHLFPLIKISDYHFVVERAQIPEWKKLNSNTFFLPQGLQDEVYDKPERLTDADRKEYVSDISFAGRRRGYRRPYLDEIEKMNLDFKKWGCAGRGKIYNEKHNKMAFLAKINFTCSACCELTGCISVRDYKIIGAGGFILELYRDGIHDIFPPDLFHCYGTTFDLIEKIRYWLDNEKEREAIAEKAYRWIHGNATYTHRIRDALEIMGL